MALDHSMELSPSGEITEAKLEEFQGTLGLRLAAYREEQRRSAAPEKALLWAAVTPSWPLSLAERCDFPTYEGKSKKETLDAMAQAALMEVRTPTLLSQPGVTLTIYTMRDEARTDALDAYGDDLTNILEILSAVGRGILDAHAEGDPAASTLWRWATLASQAQPKGEDSGLEAEFERRALQPTDADEVLNWIDAAQPLARLFSRYQELGSSLQLLLQQAGQRLELLYRQKDDLRQLVNYRIRDEQDEAFHKLMKGDDRLWALHYLGGGGMGKSLLLRHISAVLAPEYHAFTTKVDFDFLPADYPGRAPGMLLWAFAQELRLLSGKTQADSRFAAIDRRLRVFHQERGSEISRLSNISSAASDSDIERLTSNSEFVDIVAQYIEALRLLDRRVILILDTCEELAKVNPGASTSLEVEVTFRILRALHDGPQTLLGAEASANSGIPELRVIFAGRRPLAGKGEGWEWDPKRLPERNYLRLSQLRGFTHKEARDYLKRCFQIEPHLIKPVIDQSTPDGGGVPIRWTDKSNKSNEVPRCNPLILRMYAEWASEVPPPSRDQVKASREGKYVELRILRRLKDKSQEEALPLITLLAPFSREMLGKMLVQTEPSADTNALFARLQNEDWVQSRLAPIGAGGRLETVLDIEPGMRVHLLRYYRQRLPERLATIREFLAPHLISFINDYDLDQLDWSFFNSALRSLEDDPQSAVSLWAKLEGRILTERGQDWGTVEKLARSLLKNEDGVAYIPPSDEAGTGMDTTWARDEYDFAKVIRPEILATHAVALLKVQSRTSVVVSVPRLSDDVGVPPLIETWRQAEQLLKERPRLDVRRDAMLKLRAQAGQISATYYEGGFVTVNFEQALAFWWRVRDEGEKLRASGGQENGKTGALATDPQAVASLLAATEALVEQADRLAHNGDRANARKLLLSGVTPQAASTGNNSRGLQSAQDYGETPGPQLLVELINAALPGWDLPQGDKRCLLAFAYSLLGRTYGIIGSPQLAKEALDKALSSLPVRDTNSPYTGAYTSPDTWLDWRPPDNFDARIRLEYVRVLYPAAISATEALAATETVEIMGDSVDQDRLRSASLKLRLALAPVSLGKLSAQRLLTPGVMNTSNPKGLVLPGLPRCFSHVVTPPLFATSAEALAAVGRGDLALPQLRHLLTQVQQYDLETRRAADRQLASICRRMRLRDEREKRGETLSSSHSLDDQIALWTLDALDGLKSQALSPRIPDSLPDEYSKWQWTHAIWQTCYALDKDRVKAALAWAKQYIDPAASAASAVSLVPAEPIEAENYLIVWSLYFDNLESRLLAEREGLRETQQVAKFANRNPMSDQRPWNNLVSRMPSEAFLLWLRGEALNNPPKLLQSNWDGDEGELYPGTISGIVKKIGERRAAEIALEAGELLALRLPERAVCLFRIAMRLFGACGDSVGRLIAGTQLGMILGRMEDASTLPSLLRTLTPDYTLVQRSGDAQGDNYGYFQPLGMPEWNRLSDIAEDREGVASMESFHPSYWRPWEARLVLCITRAKSQRFDDTTTQRIREWLRKIAIVYGEEKGTGTSVRTALPADLSAWASVYKLDLTDVRQGGLQIEQKSKVPTWALWLGTLILVLGINVVFTLLIIPGTAGISGGNGADDIQQLLSALSWIMLIVAGIFVGLIALESLLGIFLGIPTPWHDFILSHSTVRVEVLWVLWEWESGRNLTAHNVMSTHSAQTQAVVQTLASVTTDDGPQAIIEVKVTPQFQWLGRTLLFYPTIWFLNRRVRLPDNLYRPQALAPYTTQAENLPQGLARKFRYLGQKPGSRKLDITLVIGRNLQGVCWEGIFTLVANPRYAVNSNEKVLIVPPFRVRRLTSQRRIYVPPTRLDALNIASYVIERGAYLVTQRSWSGWDDKGYLVPRVMQTSDLSKVSFEMQQIHILHLIGSVEEAGGLRFRIMGDENTLFNASQSLDVPESEGDLIEANDIVQNMPNLILCIVQGRIEPGSGERSESQRRDALLARLFASELFAQGVPAVLVVPGAPSDIAARAINAIGLHLTRYSREASKERLSLLSDMIVTIQEIIQEGFYQGESSSNEAGRAASIVRVEAALDVCLYATGDW
jgi:hypothetical protein